MSNGQDLVAVMLPRDLASEIGQTPEGLSMGAARQVQVMEACRQALSTPSVTVNETIFLSAFGDVPLVRMEIGLPDEFLPLPGPHSRPCTVTITPKGGQSGE